MTDQARYELAQLEQAAGWESPALRAILSDRTMSDDWERYATAVNAQYSAMMGELIAAHALCCAALRFQKGLVSGQEFRAAVKHWMSSNPAVSCPDCGEVPDHAQPPCPACAEARRWDAGGWVTRQGESHG